MRSVFGRCNRLVERLPTDCTEHLSLERAAFAACQPAMTILLYHFLDYQPVFFVYDCGVASLYKKLVQFTTIPDMLVSNRINRKTLLKQTVTSIFVSMFRICVPVQTVPLFLLGTLSVFR